MAKMYDKLIKENHELKEENEKLKKENEELKIINKAMDRRIIMLEQKMEV